MRPAPIAFTLLQSRNSYGVTLADPASFWAVAINKYNTLSILNYVNCKSFSNYILIWTAKVNAQLSCYSKRVRRNDV